MLKKNASTRTVRIGEMTVELFNIPLFVETPVVNTDLLENQRIIDDALKKQRLTCADLPREQLADIYFPFFNHKAKDGDDK